MSHVGLKTNYISPNPKLDPAIFLGPRKETVNEIISHIVLTMETSRVPKAVVLGPFGIGKTQFIKYAIEVLKDISHSVYIETPPCHRRSRFTDVYGVIMRRFGRRFISDLFNRARDASADRKETITEFLDLEERDLGIVIEEGLAKNEYVLWKYLTGEKLTSSESSILGVSNKQLYEDDAVWILNIIASFIRIFENKQLILFMDEMENTVNISGDSRVMFTEAIRGLVDEKSYLGIIFIDSARDIQELPGLLIDEPVKRRIGVSNYFYFEEYNENELKELFYEMIEYRRDSKFEINKAINDIKDVVKETVTTKSFPFTEEAINEVVKIVFELRRSGLTDAIRPREGLFILDDAVAQLIKRELPLIDVSVISEISDRYTKELKRVTIPP